MIRHESQTYRGHEIQLREGELNHDEPEGFWCAIDGDDVGMPVDETAKKANWTAEAVIDCWLDDGPEDTAKCSDCGKRGELVATPGGSRVCRDCWMGENWQE